MKIIIKIRTTHLTTKPKQPKEKKVGDAEGERKGGKKGRTNPIIRVEAQSLHEHASYAGTHHPHF